MNQTPRYSADTIVARATPPGRGGVAIVRLSGPKASEVASRIAGTMPQPRVATLASFMDSGDRLLDRGMLLWFPGPHSFTGEDVVEFHCHGGPLLVELLVSAAVDAGARRAEPGEVSKRAFLNDKLDLVQAEAIADLIGSGTKQAAHAAMRSLSGEFSAAVTAVQQQLTELRVYVEAALDFPEEEIDFLSDEALLKRIEACARAFDQLQQTAAAGRQLRDGLQVAIAGKPNAGKSSLLNRLSGDESAIVTDVAGTTRDVLRETIDVDGLAVQLADTAGLREDADHIEAEGIRRARRAMDEADVILWIQDATMPDEAPSSTEGLAIDPEKPVIIVRNKADLAGEAPGRMDGVVTLSAKTGDGVQDLFKALRELAGYHDAGEGALTARRRHVTSIATASRHFDAGRIQLEQNQAGEIFAEELREAQKKLGEVTGEFSSDDLLGEIFSSFCIGK